MKNYLLAASLANGNPGRFVELIKGMKGGALLLHFFLICAMLYAPLMHAVARLSPWDVFSRLNADMLPQEIGAEAFNAGFYQSGYASRALLPLLAGMYVILLVLQAAFYLLAALFAGFNRWNYSYLRFRDRLGVFIFSSTIPVAACAVFGFFLPTVHLIVFYLAEILLGFSILKKYA
ncbi:MAG: hypothetical protein LBG76_09050 [Treponema sp.]|jgi:hypothetical protein|nr:hypothetical protein [Treponema sp.]